MYDFDFNSLDEYINYLEKEIKIVITANASEILNPTSNEGLPSVIHEMLYFVFEEESEKLEKMSKENLIAYALQLAKEYIKYKQTQKEHILAVNLAFLVITEFERYVTEIKNDYDELYLLASALFITMLLMTPIDKIKTLFPELPIIETNLLKLRKKVLDEVLYNPNAPISSPIFSLYYVFENLEDFEITWGKDQVFEKLKTFINRPLDVELIWGY